MSDFNSYCENHLIKVFQYKYIQKQIRPYHKVDQGQPRIISQTYIVEPTSTMIHTCTKSL